jgi:hypothetical protein
MRKFWMNTSHKLLSFALAALLLSTLALTSIARAEGSDDDDGDDGEGETDIACIVDLRTLL